MNYQELKKKVQELCRRPASASFDPTMLETKINSFKIVVWRLSEATPGLQVDFWDEDAGPHIDPLLWTGPADTNGFPLPTAAPPTVSTVSNATNINDSNSGANNARYGIAKGWLILPAGTTHVREANANTGEFGMVLISDCSSPFFVEAPGANHAMFTSGTDRDLMDPTPAVPGPLEIYSPWSDNAAAAGWQFQYSTSGPEGPWMTAPKQVEKPTYDCEVISQCDLVQYETDGWTAKPPTPCLSARYFN